MKFKRRLLIIPLVLVVAVVLAVLSAPTLWVATLFVLFDRTRALPFRPAEFNGAVSDFAKGTLVEKAGVIELPGTMSPITVDSRVYVTRDPSVGTVLLFVTWRGKGSNLRGYIFICNPHVGMRIKNGASLTVVVPSMDGSEPTEVIVTPMSAAGWYEAERSLD